MANNVMNIATVSFDSKNELEEFLKRVKGKDDDGEKDFSLQSFLPTPESLMIVSPCDDMLVWAVVNEYGCDPENYPENVSHAVLKEVFRFHDNEKLTKADMIDAYNRAGVRHSKLTPLEKGEKVDIMAIPHSIDEFDAVAKQALSNAIAYGYASWYYWRNAYWGTKWDTFEVYTNRVNDTMVCFSFETAWNSPVCAMVELSQMFPSADIRVEYADEDVGGGNCGWYALHSGNFVDDGFPSKGDASINFACDVWGYDADEYRAELESL